MPRRSVVGTLRKNGNTVVKYVSIIFAVTIWIINDWSSFVIYTLILVWRVTHMLYEIGTPNSLKCTNERQSRTRAYAHSILVQEELCLLFGCKPLLFLLWKTNTQDTNFGQYLFNHILLFIVVKYIIINAQYSFFHYTTFILL